MASLTTNRRVLTWLCILPANETTGKCEKIMYMTFSATIIAVEVCITTSSMVYFLKNVSVDLDTSLYALFQMTGSTSLIYILVYAFSMQHKIADMFQHLSNICDSCKT